MLHHYRSIPHRHSEGGDRDPVVTEIVRHALRSAADQMKRALVRTAFTPTIYDQHDFAVAICDRYFQMLAEAPSIPLFMGTMGFCVENAVLAVGGAECLEPDDIVIYNWPYGTGSHAQDVAIIKPIFHADHGLIGYAANKAHQRDIGAKDPYCTDTIDVFQEGMVLPGVKLFKRGRRDEDIFRIIVANSRAPKVLAGDLEAQITSVIVGAREVCRVVSQFKAEQFWSAVDHMFESGESTVRRFFEKVPDGVYRGHSYMDNNGIDDEIIDIDVSVEVTGSSFRVDFSNSPDAQRGPTNCPFPSTVSATRVAIAMLAGNTESPNEGHFRAIEICTRIGSMFHPVSPQPCFVYGWPALQAMDAIFAAMSSALGGRVPSGSAGDICATHAYAIDKRTGDLNKIGSPLPVGQGAHAHGDGATVFIPGLANSRFVSVEIEEAKSPVRYEKMEFVADSGGAGEYRGGSGWDKHYKVLDDVRLISIMERTRTPSWGQLGGLAGVPNRLTIMFPSGEEKEYRKVTWVPIPSGSTFKIRAGGGGGYGPPSERAPEAVRRDLLNGLITGEYALTHHPHAM
jgi:N-methylhydantoinase B